MSVAALRVMLHNTTNAADPRWAAEAAAEAEAAGAQPRPPPPPVGPLLLVTYTNHALDATLRHLLAAGVPPGQLLRLGRNSRAPDLDAVQLHTRQTKVGRSGACVWHTPAWPVCPPASPAMLMTAILPLAVAGLASFVTKLSTQVSTARMAEALRRREAAREQLGELGARLMALLEEGRWAAGRGLVDSRVPVTYPFILTVAGTITATAGLCFVATRHVALPPAPHRLEAAPRTAARGARRRADRGSVVQWRELQPVLELGGLPHLAASFQRGLRDRNRAGLVDLVAEWRAGGPRGDAELGRLGEEGEEGEGEEEEGEHEEDAPWDGDEADEVEGVERVEEGEEGEEGEAEAPGDLDALLASGLDFAALEAVRRAEEEVERQLLGRWVQGADGGGQGGQAAPTPLTPQQLAALEARDRPLEALLRSRCVWRMSRWGRGGVMDSCITAARTLALVCKMGLIGLPCSLWSCCVCPKAPTNVSQALVLWHLMVAPPPSPSPQPRAVSAVR